MYNDVRMDPVRVMDDSAIVLGCQYRTDWQHDKTLNFIIVDFKIRNNKIKSVKLMSRGSKKTFWTNTNQLLFVNTISNGNKFNAIHRLQQAKHKPILMGYYQNIIDGSVWQITCTNDEGRPKLKSLDNGHEKSKSLGNFLGEYQHYYCGKYITKGY